MCFYNKVTQLGKDRKKNKHPLKDLLQQTALEKI